MNIHVIPLGDLIQHEPYGTCICGPTPEHVQGEDGESGWLLTHHSLDDRESTEEP